MKKITDKERLDWLQKHRENGFPNGYFSANSTDGSIQVDDEYTPPDYGYQSTSIRNAIDIAIRAEARTGRKR